MIPEQKSFEQRVEELEKQVAHLSDLLTGQSDPERTVEARRFVVRDPQGNERAVLALSEDCSGVWLYDANGNPRAGLTVLTEEGPELALRDVEGRSLLHIQLGKNGPAIRLSDANGTGRLALVLSSSGQPALGISDANGKRRVELGVDTSGTPGLTLWDGSGDLRVNLFVENAGPRLLFGKDNKVHWSAP